MCFWPTGKDRKDILVTSTNSRYFSPSFLPDLCSYKSGKTAFLDDVHEHSKHLTYIRQDHHVRPDVKVCDIPDFDPSSLPFWGLYESEGLASSVKVGGLLGGEYIAGLTLGQHKILLLEMLCQHTLSQRKLSIALDEPFEGVSDDHVPFLVDRLNRLREKHNILLTTCDHIKTLSEIADITLGMSSFDRHLIKVNNRDYVAREKAISALSVFDRTAKYYL